MQWWRGAWRERALRVERGAPLAVGAVAAGGEVEESGGLLVVVGVVGAVAGVGGFGGC